MVIFLGYVASRIQDLVNRAWASVPPSTQDYLCAQASRAKAVAAPQFARAWSWAQNNKSPAIAIGAAGALSLYAVFAWCTRGKEKA